MSVAPSEALERSVLEGKDREQLLAIAAALGVKPAARAKKADIIDKILEQVGIPAGGIAEPPAAAVRKPVRARAARDADADADAGGAAQLDLAVAVPPAAGAPAGAPVAPVAPEPAVVLGPDGEPLAEWELELARGATADDGTDDDGGDDDGPDDDTGATAGAEPGGDLREGRRRRRRRNRNRGADGETVAGAPAGAAPVASAPEARPAAAAPAERGGDDARTDADFAANEPVAVAGYVDLREEGFGFLRVRGYLATKDDIYVSVKQVRQYGLRRGDRVAGTSRAAGRNEKNPALLTIAEINGADPELSRSRRRFEELTPVFAQARLDLASDAAPDDVTGRAIDLVAPIGVGHRCLVVAAPRSGKTSVLIALAAAVERNHPSSKLLVLLLDERPEDVTDVRRAVTGEVIASTFDAKPSDHVHVAEMAVERAKRMVENGDDVVLVVDGLTRLARAYNLSAPAAGKMLPGGIDAGALHPTKRFFSAGRRLEEGGSLTIVGTVLVDTPSRLDEAVYEELKDTANVEVRLDRLLAERRVFPAIDVERSATRQEERLVPADELEVLRKLRRLVAEGVAPAIEQLADRFRTHRTNAELLRSL